MNWYNRHIKIAMPKSSAKRGWTIEELEKVKRLLEEGRSTREIGNMFGTSHGSIRALNNKYKWVNIRDKGNIHKNNLSDDDLQVMKALVEEGYTYKNIADLFGVSITAIRRINKEHGWREIKEWGSMEDVRANILEKGKQMVDMYLPPPRGQGMTLKNVAIQFNITTNTAKDYMKRTGLINDEEFRSKEETDKGHSARMLEWWKQFEGEDGQKFKNRLLSYQTRQQAINLLYSLISKNKKMITDPKLYGGVYGKYMEIINNHTYPDEVQQEVPI